MKLIFATNNANKIEEINNVLKTTDIEVVSLKEIECFDDIPEEQDTLEGNALQKARYIKEKYGFDCFADDTGLEIDALNGEPGVYSARYAGESKNAEDNMNKVLLKMQDATNRKAKFRTVIALILGDKEYIFEGKVDGEILKDKQGEQGFGYDPIFKAEQMNKSFAQMSLDEKNTISHRARATKKLCEFLSSQKH